MNEPLPPTTPVDAERLGAGRAPVESLPSAPHAAEPFPIEPLPAEHLPAEPLELGLLAAHRPARGGECPLAGSHRAATQRRRTSLSSASGGSPAAKRRS